jgi:hypothetical protein
VARQGTRRIKPFGYLRDPRHPGNPRDPRLQNALQHTKAFRAAVENRPTTEVQARDADAHFNVVRRALHYIHYNFVRIRLSPFEPEAGR